MRNRKDYVDYLMLELDKFQSWYTADLRGFGGNKSMLQIFEGVLTALNIDECRYCYAYFMDYPVYSQDCFPYIMLCALRGDRVRTYVVTIYKIGFDKDFQKNAKSLCSRIQESTSYRVKNINEYPTWRAAFNQLVADYHDLETNTQRGLLISK